MKEYLLIFRNNLSAMPSFSPEQMQANTKKWMDWIGGVAAQNKLSDRGNRLSASGKVVKPDNVVTDGPYSEIKESIGGYTIIKVNSYDEAVEIAQGCPVLKFGGNHASMQELMNRAILYFIMNRILPCGIPN